MDKYAGYIKLNVFEGGLQPFCLGEGDDVHVDKWTQITLVTEVLRLEYTNNKNENTTTIIIIIVVFFLLGISPASEV